MKTVIQLDGWSIAVDWEKLTYGYSFFVPSVNRSYDRRQLKKSAKEADVGIEIQRVVEVEVQGLRVWRID